MKILKNKLAIEIQGPLAKEKLNGRFLYNKTQKTQVLAKDKGFLVIANHIDSDNIFLFELEQSLNHLSKQSHQKEIILMSHQKLKQKKPKNKMRKFLENLTSGVLLTILGYYIRVSLQITSINLAIHTQSFS